MFAKFHQLLPYRWQRFLLLTFAFIWFGAILSACHAHGAFVGTSYLSAVICLLATLIFLFGGDGD